MLKMEQIIIFGVLLIFLGFIMVFMGAFFGPKDSDSKTKVAVGGFIGFIPFGFGNDKKLVMIITILSFAMLIFWIVFNARTLK